MAQRCVVCGKGPVAGKTISHSHKASNRRFLPNIRQVKITWESRPQRVNVCSRCMRSGKVSKVGPRLMLAV